jgi:hypothetical protein
MCKLYFYDKSKGALRRGTLRRVEVRRCEQTVFIVGLFTSETARKFKIVLSTSTLLKEP